SMRVHARLQRSVNRAGTARVFDACRELRHLTDNLATKAITPSLRPQGSPMAEGEVIATRTDFVRRAILERRYEPDASYAQDLLALERSEEHTSELQSR